MKKKRTNKNIHSKIYLLYMATGFLLAVLVLKLIPLLFVKAKSANLYIPFFSVQPSPTPDLAKQQQEITQKVLPDKLNLGVSFGDLVVKMVQLGAIDKQKFQDLYKDRGGLTDDDKRLFEEESNQEIVVTQENSGLILNFLWPLGIANKTNVLTDGPMGTQYKDEVGNFASTGGWTLGREDGGKLFNRFSLIKLSPEQEELVKEMSQAIYRPCCGNSTFFPDCNHGAAMLGFIEMAVAANMSKEEIYQKALVLNSYWFPQTYVELAAYFQNIKNTAWENINPKEVLGVDYSSGQGYQAINKELQTKGILPKVEGGGGCGV